MDYEKIIRVRQGRAEDTGAHTVTLDYVSKRPDHRWTPVSTQLRCENLDTANTVVNRIQQNIKNMGKSAI